MLGLHRVVSNLAEKLHLFRNLYTSLHMDFFDADLFDRTGPALKGLVLTAIVRRAISWSTSLSWSHCQHSIPEWSLER